MLIKAESQPFWQKSTAIEKTFPALQKVTSEEYTYLLTYSLTP
jgi:hypothetical protein